MTPSRLYRKLKAKDRLFNVIHGRGTYSDTALMRITMKRGSRGVQSGITPATCEVDVPVDVPPAGPDTPLGVVLTDYALDLLNLPRSCKGRWAGRVVGQRVNDKTDTMRSTTISAGGWAQQVPLTTRAQTVYKNAPVRAGEMLVQAWNQTRVPVPLVVSGDTDMIYIGDGDTFTVAAADVWAKYARDLGYLIRTKRDGSGEGIGLYSRSLAAQAWHTTAPTPLTRRVCLSPSTWEQPIINPGSVQWTYRKSDGSTETVIITIGWGTLSRPLAPIELDTTYMWRTTGNQERLANALAASATAIGYRPDNVVIDLLMLATSTVDSDHDLLRQLLELEEGDPITLAYDWPTTAAGVYFASEITETITPDEWRIELTLDPIRHITGEASPDPAGDTWDTAYPYTTVWDDLPTTTTWETL